MFLFWMTELAKKVDTVGAADNRVGAVDVDLDDCGDAAAVESDTDDAMCSVV